MVGDSLRTMVGMPGYTMVGMPGYTMVGMPPSCTTLGTPPPCTPSRPPVHTVDHDERCQEKRPWAQLGEIAWVEASARL